MGHVGVRYRIGILKVIPERVNLAITSIPCTLVVGYKNRILNMGSTNGLNVYSNPWLMDSVEDDLIGWLD